jgi:PLP dependent protein
MNNSISNEISDNYRNLMERVKSACKKSNRPVEQVKIIAVSKYQPIEKVLAAVELGIQCFGENYPEEALPKIITIAKKTNVEWHMIGHLQSRKASIVCQHFSYMHSLDNIHLAEKLNNILKENGRKLPVLLEVNLAGESTKSGWTADQEDHWELLIPEFQKVLDYQNLIISGLMCIPPIGVEKEQSRPYYKKIRKLQGYLKQNIPDIQWKELSMGTSFDFEVAIEEQATMIRIGEVLFGARVK